MKELQPVNQNVLLEIPEENKEKKTSAGIIIPDTVEKKQNMAKVVAMSNIENPEISVGDTVIFNEFSSKEIEFEGKKQLMVQYSEILAKIVETETI
ncbi:MAG: GroES family chaperonin [Bacteroidota bacterium]